MLRRASRFIRLTAAIPLAGLAIARGAAGQTYEVIHEFTGTAGDGANPRGTLCRVGDELFGTTNLGGDTGGLCSGGCGTVFRVDAAANVTTMHSFDASTDDPVRPFAGLVLAADGNLYGTSPNGGALGDGTVYRFDPVTGLVTTIDSFDRDAGGWFGSTSPIQGTDGDLYVATTYGACGDNTDGCSQVLRMTTGGDAAPFHTFDPEAEGSLPLSPLLQTSPEDFYGTTSSGNGAVFHLDAAGSWTLVHAFQDADGRIPVGALVRDSGGNLYGVTAFGGATNGGTIYRIDAAGGFSSLHTFDGTDGSNPESGLIQAADGLFYGTTETGGAHGFGTLYRMDSDGVVVKLHDFDGTAGDRPSPRAPDGSLVPTAALVEGSDGKLYGVRYQGGAAGFLFRYTIAPSAPLYCPNNFVRRDQMAVFLLKTEHGAAHVPPSCQSVFPDVACPGLFADWIEELASEGITAGCGGGGYCPLSPVTREQMAVFLLKTEHGSSFTPPPCAGVFTDVPCSDPFAPWIETLSAEGVTGGCGAGIFCPGNPVTRAQMAVFLLKIEHGGAYVPPACTPLFGDVACPSLFADWIEQLFAEGITAGCS